jgi:hypothetical protein
MGEIEGHEHAQNPIQPALRRLFGGVSQYPTDLGPAAIGPSQAAALASVGPPEVGLPGSNFPPAGSTPVDELGDGDIAPGGTAVLLTIRIPDTFRFRMAGIGFGADDEVALGFLRWSIRSDGDVVPGYFNMTAGIGSIRQLASIVYVGGGSSTITIVAIIDPLAVLTYRYIVRAQGWFYLERGK